MQDGDSKQVQARATARVSVAAATLARHWCDVAFVAMSAAIVAWVIYDAAVTRLITYSPGSDYWEHSAALRALMDDPWNPKHPHLGDDTPAPRFGPYFVLIALLSRAFGLDAIGAMGLAAVFNTLLFLAGIQVFFATYFRHPLAPLSGLVVLFGSWVGAPHYSNVYELKTFFSVAGYPSTDALGVTLLTFALMLNVLRQQPPPRGKLALLAFCFFYVYTTHQLTAAMTLSGAFFLAATEPGVPRARRVLVLATLPAGLCLALLWPYYQTLGVVSRGAARYAHGGVQVRREFYELETLLRTAGFALPGVLVLVYFAVRRIHLFLVLGAVVVLAPFAVNYFRPVPLGHRFVLLAMFYVQTAFVWLLLELVEGLPAPRALPAGIRRGAGIALAAGALALCLFFSVSNAAQRFEAHARRYHGRQSSIVAYARAVAARTPPGSMVLATPRDAWPLPTFGTHVVSLFHGNPLVRDRAERRTASNRFFSRRATDEERKETIDHYGVTHVLARKRRGAAHFLATRATRTRLPGGYSLYTLKRP